MDIDTQLDALPGENGTADHAKAALGLVQKNGLLIYIDGEAQFQVGEKGLSDKPLHLMRWQRLTPRPIVYPQFARKFMALTFH